VFTVGFNVAGGINASGPIQPVFKTSLVQLIDDSWVCSPDDDLAVAPIPAEALPTRHYVGAVHLDRIGPGDPYPNPDLALVGRWGEGELTNFVITRTAILATPQQPVVRVYPAFAICACISTACSTRICYN
jgi:hypothetical protein